MTNKSQSMKIEVRSLLAIREHVANSAITILPSNIDEEPAEFMYSSTALSFYKYTKGALPINFLTKPEKLYAQQSIDIFLPAILFGVDQAVKNPDLVKTMLEMAFNYVKESFIGDREPTVKAELISEKTAHEKYISISYEGPVSGIRDMAKAFIEAIKHGE